MSRGSPILTLRLPQESIDQLRSASESLGVPVATIVRDAIEDQLSSLGLPTKANPKEL